MARSTSDRTTAFGPSPRLPCPLCCSNDCEYLLVCAALFDGVALTALGLENLGSLLFAHSFGFWIIELWLAVVFGVATAERKRRGGGENHR